MLNKELADSLNILATTLRGITEVVNHALGLIGNIEAKDSEPMNMGLLAKYLSKRSLHIVDWHMKHSKNTSKIQFYNLWIETVNGYGFWNVRGYGRKAYAEMKNCMESQEAKEYFNEQIL